MIALETIREPSGKPGKKTENSPKRRGFSARNEMHSYAVKAESEELKPISVLPVHGSIVGHAHDSPRTECSESATFSRFSRLP
jgi:hypothetical protein